MILQSSFFICLKSQHNMTNIWLKLICIDQAKMHMDIWTKCIKIALLKEFKIVAVYLDSSNVSCTQFKEGRIKSLEGLKLADEYDD